ncbi:MAG: LptF/LptG family permease [Bacteroidales bacterium]
MLRIKRLYTFILQTFLPVFCMTFLICLFIVLMQFLWKYVDEMVGKGLEINVLFELFFYAALSLAPMALPLAILLASLMTFGNMGERLELLAMKAAGVSLIKIMRPLIVTVAIIAVGAFFFQNEILPRSQVKLYSLLFSMRHKSPELDIPEGVFYKEIEGYNLFVKHKNHETGMLYDVMIYNLSGSFEDAAVIVADSGKLKMTDDKQFLFLTLWDGESFENLKDQRTAASNVPYRRETFKKKEILIEFDANFNRMDESFMSNQYIGKNMKELQGSIDSLTLRSDSVANSYSTTLKKNTYFKNSLAEASSDSILKIPATILMPTPESVMADASLKEKQGILTKAASKSSSIEQDYMFKKSMQQDESKVIRRHEIEMHKKFTLSIACLLFFFIGAPLGAIIRKGGLGMPVIISVFLFIVYYIIDTAGYKFARDGQWPVWEGVWLSSAFLLPLGVFFTIKAANDSVLFNMEVYADVLRNIIGYQKKRHFLRKEVIIETLNNAEIRNDIEQVNMLCENYLKASADKRSINFINFYTNRHTPQGLEEIVVRYNIMLEAASNSDNYAFLKKLSDSPVLFKMSFNSPVESKWAGILIALLLPFSIPYYLFALLKRYQRLKALREVIKNNKELLHLLVDTKTI